MEATATVVTPNGSKYLQQLCKHWSHKFATEFDVAAGSIVFPSAVLRLAAGPEALVLTLAGDPATLDRMTGVVAEHVQRFAFRETLVFDWVRH